MVEEGSIVCLSGGWADRGPSDGAMESGSNGSVLSIVNYSFPAEPFEILNIFRHFSEPGGLAICLPEFSSVSQCLTKPNLVRLASLHQNG